MQSLFPFLISLLAASSQHVQMPKDVPESLIVDIRDDFEAFLRRTLAAAIVAGGLSDARKVEIEGDDYYEAEPILDALGIDFAKARAALDLESRYPSSLEKWSISPDQAWRLVRRFANSLEFRSRCSMNSLEAAWDRLAVEFGMP